MNDTVSALTGFFPWILPECILGLVACVLFLGATFRTNRNLWGAVAILGVTAAGVALWMSRLPEFATSEKAQAALYAGPIFLDKLAIYIKAIALAGTAILILLSWDEVAEDVVAEYHACLLVIAAGVCFTAGANDLVTLFLALELISIPTYIALYLARTTEKAQEAGVKYFLLSVFSSALLLFGFSYLYGLTGTTNLQSISNAFKVAFEQSERSAVVMIALVMIVAGLGFKITAVPFHFYAPDVYQGTSNGAAALLAFVPKVAGFVALIRVFGFVPYEISSSIHGSGPFEERELATLLWIIAAVTMTLGNVLALWQDNVRRMLAYSSVSHSGYMLVGLAAACYLGSRPVEPGAPMLTRGVDTLLFYLVAYGLMTIGAFAVLEYLSTREKPVENVDDLAGLSKSHPAIALLMTLFLLSLIGIPPTPGFAGKWELLFGAFSLPGGAGDADKQATLFRVLGFIMAINAAVGSWYYLRLITVIYLRNPPVVPIAKQKVSPKLVSVWVCAALTLLFFYPRPLFDKARDTLNNKVQVAPPPKAEAPQPGKPAG